MPQLTARPGGAPAAAGARESHASAPRAHTGIDRDRTVNRLGRRAGAACKSLNQ